MTIDSNILIGYLNGDRQLQQALNVWKEADQSLFISTVSVAEVLSFATLTTQDVQQTEAFIVAHFFVHLSTTILLEKPDVYDATTDCLNCQMRLLRLLHLYYEHLL